MFVSCGVRHGRMRRFMKTPLAEQVRQFLIRAVIAFTGVLVVAPQVSYKFYLYANLPAVSLKARHKPHIRANIADITGSLLKHERRHRLSIDKRYTAKHVFALLPASIVIADQRLSIDIPVMPRPVPCADPILVDHRLRGPPAQLLRSASV